MAAAIPSQKDTMLTKIFVGGLPYHTTDGSLRSFFEQFGEIDEAVVITDRQTAKSRGYGFVTMSDRDSAKRACNDPNPIIDGRKANVNLAYLGAKPRAFPFALKAGIPGMPLGQYGLQPYVYAPTSYMTTPGGGVIPLTAAHSQMSPTAAAAATAGQVLDYTTAAYPATAQQQLSANLAGYEANIAANYATAAQYAGIPAAYTYGVPQPLGLAAATAHYQPQQLQERMQ